MNNYNIKIEKLKIMNNIQEQIHNKGKIIE